MEATGALSACGILNAIIIRPSSPQVTGSAGSFVSPSVSNSTRVFHGAGSKDFVVILACVVLT